MRVMTLNVSTSEDLSKYRELHEKMNETRCEINDKLSELFDMTIESGKLLGLDMESTNRELERINKVRRQVSNLGF
ncbi:hypothetical protein [Limosilactobacillus portuensis]|uniref:hypothetical protein n=1 Tax=Limosilactobacillus portuensis TaxID=2742601 RepID=UPI003D746C64